MEQWKQNVFLALFLPLLSALWTLKFPSKLRGKSSSLDLILGNWTYDEAFPMNFQRNTEPCLTITCILLYNLIYYCRCYCILCVYIYYFLAITYFIIKVCTFRHIANLIDYNIIQTQLLCALGNQKTHLMCWLQYSLYCCGPELNLQSQWGTSVHY